MGSASFAYDPVNRLYRQGASGTLLRHAGDDTVTELDANGSVRRRYVPGDGGDEPILWYEGAGTLERRWYHQDERGSVIAISDANANARILTYDPYGIPGAGNAQVASRYGYTGQTWLPEIGAWHYKARIYSATLGRFTQPDPIRYGDGMNMYAYVGGDPVNFVDPSGLQAGDAEDQSKDNVKNAATVTVVGQRIAGSTPGGPLRLSNRTSGIVQQPAQDEVALPQDEQVAQLGSIIKGVIKVYAKLAPKVTKPIAKLSSDPSKLGHIFRNAPGHYRVDSPAARAEINRALGSFSHTDRFGNNIYSSLNPSGAQTWVQVRNGVVQNAGVNSSPVNILSRFP